MKMLSFTYVPKFDFCLKAKVLLPLPSPDDSTGLLQLQSPEVISGDQ